MLQMARERMQQRHRPWESQKVKKAELSGAEAEGGGSCGCRPAVQS